MKPANRFGGCVHDRIECPDVGALFDVVVIGPEPSDMKDDVTIQAAGRGINVSLRLSRDQARRLGELLTQAANDGVEMLP